MAEFREDRVAADGRMPVSILTGFLGSGKTTLLNRMLRRPEMGGTLVIVNEFGEVGLDHLMVETAEDETVLLNNGCLCCSVLGDLVVTLGRLLERRDAGELPPFDRVVIETTGLADPAPLLHTVLVDPEISHRFQLDRVITVVDAANGWSQLDRHRESVKQAAVADTLVLSKTDLAPAGAPDRLRGRLRRLNPGAVQLTAVKGDVSEGELLRHGAGRDWDAWLGVERAGDAEHGKRETGHHHLDDGVRTFTVRRSGEVSGDGLRLWLSALSRFQGPSLLRVKGIVNVEGRPVVVQAVQHLFHEPQELEAWPTAECETRVVFITDRLERSEVEATLSALGFTAPTGATAGLGFDAADYRRFLDSMSAFGAAERH